MIRRPSRRTEIERVLAAEARLVIFTSTPEQMRRYWLCHYFPEMMARSAAQMPNVDTVMSALAAAGFRWLGSEPYHVQPSLKDLFLYSAKHQPEIYLDPRIRAGISSFASLASEDEIADGCAQLARDIKSERINDIVATATVQSGGDYLFCIAGR